MDARASPPTVLAFEILGSQEKHLRGTLQRFSSEGLRIEVEFSTELRQGLNQVS